MVESLAFRGMLSAQDDQHLLADLIDVRQLIETSLAEVIVARTTPEAMAKLRPPVFWKERDAIIAQARLWTAKKLNAAYEVLWAAELRCKTAGAPQDLIAADAYRSIARLVGSER